jgi:hypothetical protein
MPSMADSTVKRREFAPVRRGVLGDFGVDGASGGGSGAKRKAAVEP